MSEREYRTAEERSADALERIADALEALVARDDQGAEKRDG
jgi:hypothetical protein